MPFPSSPDREDERRRMVERQLRARDIDDPRVLDAMLHVPRHLFVPESQRPHAYDDTPLFIGHDQTISQPYIVAFMTQALQVSPADRRARGRQWIRVSGGGARRAGEDRLLDGDRRAARRAGARDAGGTGLS